MCCSASRVRRHERSVGRNREKCFSHLPIAKHPAPADTLSTFSSNVPAARVETQGPTLPVVRTTVEEPPEIVSRLLLDTVIRSAKSSRIKLVGVGTLATSSLR